jgi:renalase
MSTRRDNNFQCDHGAQYFTARDPAFVAELERWLAAGVAQAWHPLLHQTEQISGESTVRKKTRRFVGTPRMNSVLHWMSQDLDIHTSTLVTDVSRARNSWQIQAVYHDATMTPEFDALVLAIPAPQAAMLLPGSLTSLRSVCTRQKMFACWAVMLGFGHRLPVNFDAAFSNDGPLRWLARDSSKPGRPDREVWLLHASRHWTEQHPELPPGQVADALKQAFCAFTGLPQETVVHDHWHAHRWRYAQSEPGPDSPGSQWDNANRIGICGDWLHDGRVEGAWLSGQALAERVLMSR